MAFGAGKYDEECNVARVMAQAKGALLIIIDGDRGEGFSAQIDARYIERIPAMPEMKPQEVRERMGVFWDWVANHFIQDQSVIREFEAVYNETVNPNGEHNVSLRVIPARAVIAFHLFIPCP